MASPSPSASCGAFPDLSSKVVESEALGTPGGLPSTISATETTERRSTRIKRTRAATEPNAAVAPPPATSMVRSSSDGELFSSSCASEAPAEPLSFIHIGRLHVRTPVVHCDKSTSDGGFSAKVFVKVSQQIHLRTDPFDLPAGVRALSRVKTGTLNVYQDSKPASRVVDLRWHHDAAKKRWQAMALLELPWTDVTVRKACALHLHVDLPDIRATLVSISNAVAMRGKFSTGTSASSHRDLRAALRPGDVSWLDSADLANACDDLESTTARGKIKEWLTSTLTTTQSARKAKPAAVTASRTRAATVSTTKRRPSYTDAPLVQLTAPSFVASTIVRGSFVDRGIEHVEKLRSMLPIRGSAAYPECMHTAVEEQFKLIQEAVRGLLVRFDPDALLATPAACESPTKVARMAAMTQYGVPQELAGVESISDESISDDENDVPAVAVQNDNDDLHSLADEYCASIPAHPSEPRSAQFADPTTAFREPLAQSHEQQSSLSPFTMTIEATKASGSTLASDATPMCSVCAAKREPTGACGGASVTAPFAATSFAGLSARWANTGSAFLPPRAHLRLGPTMDAHDDVKPKERDRTSDDDDRRR